MGEKTENLLKKMNIFSNKYIYIILLIGVVFMLFASGHSSKKEEKPAQEISFTEEKELETIISKIRGVGQVDVMVTYYSGMEKALAYETQQESNKKENGEETSINKKAVMSDGAPVVLKNLYPKVKGVVVVAEGAGNVTVKKEIQDAVTTALDVAVHKVCVLEKND